MSKEHKITLVVEGDCPGVRRESAEKKPGVHGGQTTGCLMDVSWMCIAQILRITWEDTISTISLNMFLTWDGSPKKGATVILMLRGCKKLISVTGLFERPSHTHTHTWLDYELCTLLRWEGLMNPYERLICVCVCVGWSSFFKRASWRGHMFWCIAKQLAYCYTATVGTLQSLLTRVPGKVLRLYNVSS